MERLLLWFLEGLAEGQGGPQARRREAPPKRTGGPLARRETAGGLRPEYRPLAGTLRGCTAEARTSDISDLQEFERAR